MISGWLLSSLLSILVDQVVGLHPTSPPHVCIFFLLNLMQTCFLSLVLSHSSSSRQISNQVEVRFCSRKPFHPEPTTTNAIVPVQSIPTKKPSPSFSPHVPYSRPLMPLRKLKFKSNSTQIQISDLAGKRNVFCFWITSQLILSDCLQFFFL